MRSTVRAPDSAARRIASLDELLAGTLAPRRLVHDDVFDPGADAGRRTEDDERQRADDLAVGAAGQEDRRGG